MPRRKKTAGELTDAEALKKLFPKRVRDKARKAALDSQKKSTKDQSK